MQKLTRLFEPGKIGKMELKNRLAAAPLGLSWCTKPDGYLTDQHVAYFETMAKGGAGLLQLAVNVLAPPFAPRLGFTVGGLTIHDDKHVLDAQRLTRTLHNYGTKVSFQVRHFPTGLSKGYEKEDEGLISGSPSGIPDPRTGSVLHKLTVPEIEGMVEAYGPAVRRGIAAGFDAVQIYGCHSGLIHDFLSPRTNKRTDQYGGSVKNRARLPCEIIQRLRKEAGPDYPIIIRMNGSDFIDGGITLDQAIEHARLFKEAGADALDVSAGPVETSQWQYPTLYHIWAPLVPLAAAIKKATGATVMTTAKIDALHGERILQDGLADFIQMGRALMADPELPNKAKEGRLEDIAPCIYCGHCQVRIPSVTCTVNVAFGRELEYRLKPAEPKKKVMVIGGGPGGMEAAATLAERGHETSLYEKSDRLGGQWNIVSSYRPEADRLVKYLSRRMEKQGVKVFLNQEVNREMVSKIKPEAVVVAAGAAPATLEIPGIAGRNVVQATDVLTGKVEVGQEVVVIGGRLVGIDTTLFLAEKGKQVSLVSRHQIARGTNSTLKKAVTELLVKYRIRLYPNSIPDSITANGVNIWWNSGEPPEKDWVFFFLKADTVILAVGETSNNQLAKELKGITSEIYEIGDCVEVRDACSAIREGNEAGQKI
jgi:2,4-dienoyl-CoA reductase-like NADH-dependent reductase (Old Yellow Enzyme family)/NADPH-dependent 2,4-dienoyl-CoA reductase/sulfur reductase-like enzyme